MKKIKSLILQSCRKLLEKKLQHIQLLTFFLIAFLSANSGKSFHTDQQTYDSITPPLHLYDIKLIRFGFKDYRDSTSSKKCNCSMQHNSTQRSFTYQLMQYIFYPFYFLIKVIYLIGKSKDHVISLPKLWKGFLEFILFCLCTLCSLENFFTP